MLYHCTSVRADRARRLPIIAIIMAAAAAAAGCYPGVSPLVVPRQQGRGARFNNNACAYGRRGGYICPGRTRPRLAPRRIPTFRVPLYQRLCVRVCVQTRFFPVTAASVGADRGDGRKRDDFYFIIL